MQKMIPIIFGLNLAFLFKLVLKNWNAGKNLFFKFSLGSLFLHSLVMGILIWFCISLPIWGDPVSPILIPIIGWMILGPFLWQMLGKGLIVGFEMFYGLAWGAGVGIAFNLFCGVSIVLVLSVLYGVDYW